MRIPCKYDLNFFKNISYIVRLYCNWLCSVFKKYVCLSPYLSGEPSHNFNFWRTNCRFLFKTTTCQNTEACPMATILESPNGLHLDLGHSFRISICAYRHSLYSLSHTCRHIHHLAHKGIPELSILRRKVKETSNPNFPVTVGMSNEKAVNHFVC